MLGNETDFDSKSRFVIFHRGVVEKNVEIPIINDDLIEPLENFMLSLRIQPKFLAKGVVAGVHARAIGVIIDDDGTYKYHTYIWCYGMDSQNSILLCLSLTYVTICMYISNLLFISKIATMQLVIYYIYT